MKESYLEIPTADGAVHRASSEVQTFTALRFPSLGTENNTDREVVTPSNENHCSFVGSSLSDRG